jgi:hypothetical protein
MASRSSIPEALWPEVLEQSANGWATRKIADWLGQVHGVKVAHNAVADLLKKLRQQREEISKAIVREKLGKTVLLDLQALEKEGQRVRKVAKLLYNALSEDDLEQAIPYLKAAEQHRKLIETKLKFAGADSPDDRNAELAAAAAEVARRLGAQPAAEEEDGGDPPPGSDDEGASGPSLPLEILGPSRAVRPPRGLVDLAHPLGARLGQEPHRRRVGAPAGRERPLQAPGPGGPHRRRCPRRHGRG